MKDFIFVTLTAAFLTFTLAGFLFTIFKNKMAVEKRVEEYLEEPERKSKEETEQKGLENRLKKLFQIYWNKGLQLLNSQVSKNEKKKLDMLLRDAGYPAKTAIDVRLLQVLISVAVCILILFLLLPEANNLLLVLVMAITVILLAFRLPIFYLERKKAARVKQIDRDMADFFDSVDLLLGAGMGLDLALAEVARKLKGPLSEEILETLNEMKLGKTRKEAFHALRGRVPSDTFQSVITAMIQADQLGIGMASVLSNMTIRIREHRKETAREMAMKAPVKMVFPMVIFIFPAIFIVLLGPFVIQLLTKGLGG